MKRYIRSASDMHNAKDAANAVKDYLEDILGLEGVRLVTSSHKKAGMSTASVAVDIRYEEYDDARINKHVEKLLKNRPEVYDSYETAYNFVIRNVPKKNAEYHNFVVLSDLLGAGTKGDYHSPLTHQGSEYTELGDNFKYDIESFLQSIGYADATIGLKRAGFYGINQTIKLIIYVPKA